MQWLVLFCSFLALPSLASVTNRNWAGASSLPSGPGLAATVSHDLALTNHPEVIFVDDFETGELGGHWDESRNPQGKVLRFVDPAAPWLGKRCVQVQAHLGQDTGGGFTKGPSRAHGVHPLLHPVRGGL